MNITKSDIAKVALLTTKIENMELSTRAYTALMGIHFDDSGDCTGCRWKDRPQKCSCCRRNQNLKDCYEEAQK